MAICNSRVTEEEWQRRFAGPYDTYILVTNLGRYSALCPSHAHLVGQILCGGAYELAPNMPGSEMAQKIKAAHLDHLSQHLWASREDGDFTISCGGKELRAHRSVLAAASPAFQAMISSDMLEGRTQSLAIPDAEIRDVQSMLQFIYTGELDKDSNVCGIVRVADKYGIDGLVELCCSRILADFGSDTAVEAVRALRVSGNTTMVATFEQLSAIICSNPVLCRTVLRQL